MEAKKLRNPELLTKFKVGDRVKLPAQVWQRLTSKLAYPPVSTVAADVAEVGPQVIEHGKNRLCRFGIRLLNATSVVAEDKIVWEEWMLTKIEIISTMESDMRAIKDSHEP
jgi:hypothetical protein